MRLFGPRKSRSTTSARRRPGFRPCLDALEDRYVPSAPGTLDTAFGSGGIVTTSFAKTSNQNTFAVAVQPEGKIVTAGDHSTQNGGGTVYLDVLRYNSNGTLDSSFGSGGSVQTKMPAIDPTRGSLLIQPDGKILVLNNVNGTFELVRYTSAGALDTTFNGTGMVNTAFPYAADVVRGLGLETVNGVTMIVASGDVSLSGSQDAFALARYNLNGTLDTTFGSGGKVVTNLGYDADLYDLAIQGDGKIVVGGVGGTGPVDNFTLARYDTSGSLDPTFGNAGISTALPGWAMAVVVQPDGRIVAAGRTWSNTGAQPQWGLERLNSDGSVDTRFGTGGLVLGPGGGWIRGMVLQTNGKLVVYGDGSTFALARYNTDGSLDTTFGTGGQVNTQIGGPAHALALQANGEIVAAGSAPSTKNGPGSFVLARYWGDPVPVIGSFTASTNPVTSGTNLTLTVSNISDANPTSTITQVAFYVDSSTGNGKLDTNDTLLGYATQSSPSVWTFTFTVNLTPSTYTLFAQAENSLGVLSYADALTLTVQ
jgi:uncharacterized delta-60 repeat protein